MASTLQNANGNTQSKEVDKQQPIEQNGDLSVIMRNTMKTAIKTACDNYALPIPDNQMISDHLLALIISFVRGKLQLNEITKPTNLVEAYGELNIRGELEGYCYLKYEDEKTFEGQMCNGQTEGSWEYLVQAWALTIGFTHITLQENHSFALVLDDKYEINFGLLKNSQDILIVSYVKNIKIQQLKDDIRLLLYEKLLKANFAFTDSGQYSGALGVCPNAEYVVFSVTKPLKDMDVKKMAALFDHVVKATEQWEKQINAIAPAAK